MYTIYKITNPDGKCYVGMTHCPLNVRMAHHKESIHKWPEKKISKSFKRYGFKNHLVSIIETVSSEREAKIKEAKYIKQFGELNTRFGLNVEFKLSELKKEYAHAVL